MRHSPKIIAAAILFTVGLTSNTFAQQSISSADPAFARNNGELLNHPTTSVAPNDKIGSSFSALFPNATNPLWAAIANNCYYVSFVNNGRKANASFTEKGNMNYCITDCSMDNLPASFRKSIKKQYPGYRLIKATELKAHGTVVYEAVMETSKGFKTLKYTEDGIEEVQKVKKQ